MIRSRRVYTFISRTSHLKRLQAITRYLYIREREMLGYGYSS
jgi:hypothetical protein